MVLLYIGSFRSLFVSFPIFFCFRSSALHSSISSFTLALSSNDAGPPSPSSSIRPPTRTSPRFSKIPPSGNRCSSSTSPCGSVAGRAAFTSVFSLLSPLTHLAHRVLVSCYPRLTYINPCALPFKGRRLWPLSFYFCVLLLFPDRLTTSRSTLPPVAPLVLCFFRVSFAILIHLS